MLGTMSMRLTEARPSATIEIVADENSKFYIYEDVDVKGDKNTKGRIEKDGIWNLIVQTCRRICGIN